MLHGLYSYMAINDTVRIISITYTYLYHYIIRSVPSHVTCDSYTRTHFRSKSWLSGSLFSSQPHRVRMPRTTS